MADTSRDINYIPRDAAEDEALPVASADASTLAFVEGQRQAQPTKLKSVEDPSLADRATDPRLEAYERDARSMRCR